MAVYTVSDLHGQYDAFVEGLEKIDFGGSDELYVIGDAIDRGPNSIRILEHIKEHKNMDLLIGNHEFMMLNSVDLNGKEKCNGEDAYTFVTGHVPVIVVMRESVGRSDFNELRIFEKGNFIDIDGGYAVGYREGIHNGALFLRLDDRKVFPIPLRAPA